MFYVYMLWTFYVIIIHHQVVPPARISLALSRHFSLSFIAFGRSSGLHPVSSHNCCMYVRAGRPAFARPYAGVHRSTSLMSSSLLLQQCPACLVRLTCIVFVMGGNWPYSWCLVGCWRMGMLQCNSCTDWYAINTHQHVYKIYLQVHSDLNWLYVLGSYLWVKYNSLTI